MSKDKKSATVYQPSNLILKKKKVLFMNKTIQKEQDIEDEKKEDKKAIRLLPKQYAHDDYVNKKRKYQELHLEKTEFYQNLNESNYNQTQEAEELGLVKKRIVDYEEALFEERKRKEEEERERNIAARVKGEEEEDEEDIDNYAEEADDREEREVAKSKSEEMEEVQEFDEDEEQKYQ
mmetsp:Transcript_37963/g.33994  ORF Transcript_37963/g.33994 Transcript_37963/m.33994 type:complete len:178 (-) Transcript_37963:446-979(-)